MAKRKRNPAIGPMSGKIKDLHYANYGDKQVVRGGNERKPTTKWTESQVQSQGKFEIATNYGKQVLADPAKKAQYREVSKAKHRSEWNLAIADARKPPIINDIEVSGYHGQPDEPILIAAVDDIKVAGVSLVIQTAAGALIEQGPATFDTKSSKWIYVTQAAVPESELAVAIEVTAVDLPGNRVQKQVDRSSAAADEARGKRTATKNIHKCGHWQLLVLQPVTNSRATFPGGCYNICNNILSMILKPKIRKFGNSLGLILPREALARLHVEESDTLFFSETTEAGYRLTAGDPLKCNSRPP